MSTPVSQKYKYGDLTWPEVNEAIKIGKIILLPIGSTEQHGKHLPLDVDNFLASSVCHEAGKRMPEKILVAPTIPYGFNIHAMDFPGTMHVAWDNFINYCTDVCKSFAYHGFKKIIIVNGHGSNMPLLEYVARRAVLETDALVTCFMWLSLLRKNREFLPSVRESDFPGGCAHAGELETSVYLHLDESKVYMDQAEDSYQWYNENGQDGYYYIDLFGSGPVTLFDWTSTYTEIGSFGQPSLATKNKGKLFFEEATNNLIEYVGELFEQPMRSRKDHHDMPPSCDPPKV